MNFVSLRNNNTTNRLNHFTIRSVLWLQHFSLSKKKKKKCFSFSPQHSSSSSIISFLYIYLVFISRLNSPPSRKHLFPRAIDGAALLCVRVRRACIGRVRCVCVCAIDCTHQLCLALAHAQNKRTNEKSALISKRAMRVRPKDGEKADEE